MIYILQNKNGKNRRTKRKKDLQRMIANWKLPSMFIWNIVQNETI